MRESFLLGQSFLDSFMANSLHGSLPLAYSFCYIQKIYLLLLYLLFLNTIFVTRNQFVFWVQFCWCMCLIGSPLERHLGAHGIPCESQCLAVSTTTPIKNGLPLKMAQPSMPGPTSHHNPHTCVCNISISFHPKMPYTHY